MPEERQSWLPARPPSRLALGLAFAALYVVWGSTYLAIRFAIQTLPPFLMAGTRFVVAGSLLYAWHRARGTPRPTLRQWGGAAVAGGLMLFLGNGGVSWSEQYVPSGLASLLIATVPLWLVLLNWAERGGSPPSGLEYLGIAIGLAGVVLLIEPGTVTDADSSAGSFYLMGVIVLLLASGAWAAGSLFSRRGVLPRRPLYATSMMMMCGGTLLLAFSVLLGEPARVSIGSVSLESALALLYLIVFGSLIAFSAYTWLLRVTRPALVGTYAYVNPVVAVLLGWWLADEPVTARTLAGMVVIVGSVILVRRSRTPGSPAARG